MRLKLRVGLLLCLGAAAVLSGIGAAKSLRPVQKSNIPQEIYSGFSAKADSAQFFLKCCGEYVAVYEGAKDKKPVTVTRIELDCLRGADRAMLEAGIPVADRQELLLLLEDLGS